MSASFGGPEVSGPIAGLAGVRERFGEDSEEYKDYERLLKATKSLLTIGEGYYLAPEGSVEEYAAATMLAQMMEKLRENPIKAVTLVESLMALVVHMMHEGTYEEWFEGVGDDEDAPADA